MLLLLPLLAPAEAGLHPFPSPRRLHLQQQQEAVLRTPAGSRLAVLAAFSLLLIHGRAQVLLQQGPPSECSRGLQCVLQSTKIWRGARADSLS